MTDPKPFAPAWGQDIAITNATTATAAVVLPKNCEQIVVTNTSSTARVHILVTPYLDESSPATGTAPTLTLGLPIIENTQRIISVGKGCKVLRTIATAADGQLIVSPGNGL